MQLIAGEIQVISTPPTSFPWTMQYVTHVLLSKLPFHLEFKSNVLHRNVEGQLYLPIIQEPDLLNHLMYGFKIVHAVWKHT